MTEQITFGGLLEEGRKRLLAETVETPELDARIILQHCTGLSHAGLISAVKEFAEVQVADLYFNCIARRSAGEPVHRITGSKEFYGRSFLLSSETLIPRPETETLVEVALDFLKARDRSAEVLEIGTGSGVIAVSLTCELPGTMLTATDIAGDAIDTARKNAVRHRVDDRIEFCETNLFDGLKVPFDLIVSNPPYIATDDIADLQSEVRDHDPIRALDGGPDGLGFYRSIFAEASRILVSDGGIAVEIGLGQANAVSQLARVNGFERISITSDISGIERVLFARR
ncbi:MAG: peptide chain release factor N(5)-glutamine methyltransferase [Pseudomonadota bacterium]